MPLPLKPFHMIRHGQSTANAAGVFAGIEDVPLTEQGKQEAQQARKILLQTNASPSIIIHSKLSRARDTASIINEGLNLKMIEHPDIHEQHFGDWENGAVEKFIHCYSSRTTPENGESFDDFEKRITEALIHILEQYENPLIVCHGGVFRAFNFIYNQGRFGAENAIPYYFQPKPNKDFPWDITLIE